MSCPQRQPRPRGTSSDRRLLDAIMNPKCISCSDTGVIPLQSFNPDDPTTHNDWYYCPCSVGVNLLLDDEINGEYHYACPRRV